LVIGVLDHEAVIDAAESFFECMILPWTSFAW
jgi:hypothetical protein